MEEIQIIGKENYPPQLLEIPQIPHKLFIRGTMPPPDSLFLSVVGSRKYTEYGKEACKKIIGELRGHPIVIVSGLALGIDAIAHHAALDAGLTTIAFPGSGLRSNVLYPAGNYSLAERIIQRGGALISEFEPDFRATPYAFPQRNRLMAGISHATLVVEAAEKSGTLITARMALDYNRDVFVVPGPIFSPSAQGSNWLLKQGAIPITTGKDLLEHWHLAEDTEAIAKNMFENCSPEEQRILSLVSEGLPKDELVRQLDIPVYEASALLSAMEIKGLIKETMGEVRINF